MALSAGDLPPQVKRHLLEQVRSQIGDDLFNRLIATIGEDAVIEGMLQPAETGPPARRPWKLPEWVGGAAESTSLMLGAIFCSVLCNPSEAIDQFKASPALSKLVIGSFGLVVNLLLLLPRETKVRRVDKAGDSKPMFPTDGCLGALSGLVSSLLMLWGAIFSLVLLVWGVLDLCR